MSSGWRSRVLWLVLSIVFVAGTNVARADGASTAPAINSGDTAWMLTSTALVLMMTVPGLALFYGGLVRSKNVLSTLMHSFFCAALISIVWVVCGYSLSFGPDRLGGLIGGLEFAGLKGIFNTTHALAPTIPQVLFVAYQGTFAIITPALISGTFAERMRFPAFALYMLLWSLLIYTPLCHWVWGGGWIMTKLGALDFAGGTVVHISSGISALVTALYLGKRVGHGHEPMPPHNLPFTVIGASLLWVGWFGFNAGSALASNELAATAFLNTNTAAAAAALGWLIAELSHAGKPTILGIASGAVAGLVGITPAAGFVTPLASIVIGLVAGVVCYTACTFLKPRFGYDDALDVVGVHFMGGSIGAILTGVFATTAVNSAGKDGLLHGNPGLVWTQLLAVLATYAFCAIGNLVILVIVNAVTKVRAEQDEEIIGMDLSQHSERAYAFVGGEAVMLGGKSEPKPASVPPTQRERFSVVLEGVEPAQMAQQWRHLCQDRGDGTSVEFKAVYAQFATLRGNRFRFRGGDREVIRANVEKLFRPVAPAAKALLEMGT